MPMLLDRVSEGESIWAEQNFLPALTQFFVIHFVVLLVACVVNELELELRNGPKLVRRLL